MIEQDPIPYHRPIQLSDYDKFIMTTRIEGCLDSGQLTNGIWVRELERKVKEMYDIEHVIATSSCTQALLTCLYRLQTPIQIPAFNWWSDIYVLMFLNKGTCFNDIDRETWLPIETKPIDSLYLHTFGNIGHSFNPNAIYDASHCFGAKIEEFGLATCISLAPTKLITGGDGGLILTNEDKFARYLTEMRDKCCRMPETNAIIALQTLQYLDKVLEWKLKVRTYYEKKIPGEFQKITNNSNHNTIGFINSNDLKIPDTFDWRRYYEPLTKDLNNLPNTKLIYENIVCLPSYYDCPYEEITEQILEVNGL